MDFSGKDTFLLLLLNLRNQVLYPQEKHYICTFARFDFCVSDKEGDRVSHGPSQLGASDISRKGPDRSRPSAGLMDGSNTQKMSSLDSRN